MKETIGLIKNQVFSELKSESNVNIKRDQKTVKTHSSNQSGQYYKMQCFLLENALLKNAPFVSSLTKAVIRYPSFFVD